MISWTNLLTRAIVPAACFLLFLVPGSQKMNILGIGRDKSQSCYFTRRHLEPEYETEEGQGLATPPRRGLALPAPPGGVGPWHSTDLALWPIRSLPKPKP